MSQSARRAKRDKAKRPLFIAAGCLCVLDTVVIGMVSNMLLGVLLPLIIGLPPLFYGLFYPRLRTGARKGAGRALKRIVCAGYAAYFLLIALCACLNGAVQALPPGGADAVIVLGAGIRQGQATAELESRLQTAAAYLLKHGQSVAVVTGGQESGSPITQASVMSEFLTRSGVSQNRILEEDGSNSTLENFVHSKRILDRLFDRPYRVVYVTSDYHVYRAGLTAAAAGLSAQGLPAATPWYLYPNNYLRESLAVLKTWVFGVEQWTGSL